ncbi:MAG: ABC transporter ATP-binding protein [Rhodomicrobium sp.]
MTAALHPSPGSVVPRFFEEAALETIGLSHSYGARKALNDVSVHVAPSTFTVLLGLNGAGKSTLFALVTRLFNAQTGEIRIFGQELRRQPGAALKLLGVVFQSRTLDLDLSVLQNLQYHAALHGMSGREARSRADEVLGHVALGGRAHDKARTLSGGQMRRVEIARALLHKPRLLLLDEPTVGLDIEARADIVRHVRDLVASEGISVLWATHLIDEVLETDRVIVLHKGAVRAQGRVSEVTGSAGTKTIGEAFTKLTQASPRGRDNP